MEPIKFRDMTPEQRSEIVEALITGSDDVEYYYEFISKWVSMRAGPLSFSGGYRLKTRQLVIPWDVLRPEIVCVTMDADCWVSGHKYRPIMLDSCWYSGPCQILDADIDTTGIYWRESLVMRPGYESAAKGE